LSRSAQLFTIKAGHAPLISTFLSSVNCRPAQLPLGDTVEPGSTAPLGVDAPNIYVRRTIEPAAWVRPRAGVPAQRTPASGEQHRQTDQNQRSLVHIIAFTITARI
jgi:hypothetical protein